MSGINDEEKSFPLRIDPELYEVLQKWAADDFRSINSHIEYLLREAAKKPSGIQNKKKIDLHEKRGPNNGLLF
ncbi:Arc family DNA-binding protein [Niallia circulans]